jgi:hypothetical protein
MICNSWKKGVTTDGVRLEGRAVFNVPEGKENAPVWILWETSVRPVQTYSRKDWVRGGTGICT